MKLHAIIFFALLSVSATAQNQIATPKKLVVVSDFNQYLTAVKANPNNELVEIKKAIPSIKLDIKYATKHNFMQQVMYSQARAFARKPVVDALKKIQAELKHQGLGLKIFDGYRPYQITVTFYKKASNKNFVANPAKGSKHNRGCALDLTIINLKTGKELIMPTPYDSFAKEAAADFDNLTPEIKANRDYLIKIMAKYGLKVLHNEWWHYDFIDWQAYDLMDIPFYKL